MARRKHIKYQEIKEFNLVIEESKELYKNIRGNWNNELFKNQNPIVLELGCGSGEYTLGLAEKFPEKNFIGVDIKGDRLHNGVLKNLKLNLTNVYFLRAPIENLESFFNIFEVSEIWITFPDPQPNDPRKRLTSERFLKIYKNILKSNNLVYLKTDSQLIYESTLENLNSFDIKDIEFTSDLYQSRLESYSYNIYTHYEKKYLALSQPIYFIKWKM